MYNIKKMKMETMVKQRGKKTGEGEKEQNGKEKKGKA